MLIPVLAELLVIAGNQGIKFYLQQTRKEKNEQNQYASQMINAECKDFTFDEIHQEEEEKTEERLSGINKFRNSLRKSIRKSLTKANNFIHTTYNRMSGVSQFVEEVADEIPKVVAVVEKAIIVEKDVVAFIKSERQKIVNKAFLIRPK